MKNLFFFLFISLIVTSCATGHKLFFPTVNNLPVHTGEVKILDTLPEKYVEVGWVKIKGNYTWIEMYQAAKDQARQHGANAIVYYPENNKYAGGGVRSITCRAVYLEGEEVNIEAENIDPQ